ncbi:MAG: hypothetical protein KJ626_16835 [Verrucomicrobia bacterium]|nr:hypothetical protein [Verrucomicrobiota bacterium]
MHLAILHTADVNGNVLGQPLGSSGLLRLASLVNEIRERNPSSFLVDSGNILWGSVESEVTRGELAAYTAEHLGYDVLVPGRVDFEMGIGRWMRLLGGGRGEMLAANVVTRDSTNSSRNCPGYCIRKVDGITVAFIGVTSGSLARAVLPERLEGYRALDTVEALTAVLPEVRKQKPDITVLVASQGLLTYRDDGANNIQRIAEMFPEIDIIIGGSTGRVVAEARLGRTLYSQSGSKARFLGCVNIDYDTLSRRIVESTLDMLSVETSTQEDKALRDVIDERYGKTLKSMERSIGAFPGGTGRTDGRHVIGRAMRLKTSSQVSIHSFQCGRITEMTNATESSLCVCLPEDRYLGVCSLNVSELETILREDLSESPRYDALTVTGVDYEIDPEEGGVTITAVNGEKPHPRRRFSVVMDGLTLASRSGRNRALREIVNQPTSRMKLTNTTGREALREYLSKRAE